MSSSYRTIKEYIELYAAKHGISVEEARDAIMVKEFAKYQEEGKRIKEQFESN